MDRTKMADTRNKRAKLNIMVSLLCQLLTLLCGLIVPQLMIGHFGSEAYGATASITQFLAYITLLEGGIGGVARAALYKPLAQHDIQKTSEIIAEIKRFFRIVGYIFVVYVLVVACGFKTISHIECFDWINTFWLVVVISISTIAQYFIGISYSVLIQASQRQYITNVISILATSLNTILVVLLVKIGSNLIIVKLISSCVFVLRPVLLWLYVKKNFKLVQCDGKNTHYLKQRWAGLGQHIAFFLYSNTDIAVLTVLSGLTSVSVYSVYYMITSHIQSLISSFSTGMEAVFGDMIAKDEIKELHESFGRYETLISIITTTFFAVTSVLIVPFVKLYTEGVTDVEYIRPIFSLLLILASVVTCLRVPYHNITIAAGHFKQTQVAAYGEALINIGLSLILVIRLGLIGVAIGTLTATIFRMIYYVFYLSRNIFKRKIYLFVKREGINTINFLGIYFLGKESAKLWDINNYFRWAMSGVCITLISASITLGINYVFYRADVKSIVKIHRL